jgi:hypothetical protein
MATFNIGTIFTELVAIEGEVIIDEAELAAGKAVQLPARIIVGSTGGAPIYLVGELTTVKPEPPLQPA